MPKSGGCGVGIGASVAAFLVTWVANSADAAPTYPSLSTSADAFAEAFIGNADTAIVHQYNTDYGTNSAGTTAAIDQTYTENVADPSADLGVTPFTWEVKASGSGTATADYGSLHAVATSAFQLIPGSITFTGLDGDGNAYSETTVTPFEPEAGGQAAADAVDAFTLRPPTAGSPLDAQVKFTMTLEAGVIGCRSPGVYGGSDADSSLTLYGPPNLNIGTTILSASIGCNTPSLQTVSVTETLGLGNTYVFDDGLAVLTQAPTSDCTAPSCDQESLFANAADTQLLYIDVLTPGVTLDTESGHDYGTPTQTSAVPEPASLVLFGSAIAAFGLRRRRRASGESCEAAEPCPKHESPPTQV